MKYIQADYEITTLTETRSEVRFSYAKAYKNSTSPHVIEHEMLEAFFDKVQTDGFVVVNGEDSEFLDAVPVEMIERVHTKFTALTREEFDDKADEL